MEIRLHESGARLELNQSHLLKLMTHAGKSEGDGRLTDADKEQAQVLGQQQKLPECTNQYRLRHSLPLRIVSGMGNCRICVHNGLNEICPGYEACQIVSSTAQISYSELM